MRAHFGYLASALLILLSIISQRSAMAEQDHAEDLLCTGKPLPMPANATLEDLGAYAEGKIWCLAPTSDRFARWCRERYDE